MRALRWERTLVHRFAEQMAVRTAYAGSEAHDFHSSLMDHHVACRCACGPAMFNGLIWLSALLWLALTFHYGLNPCLS